MSEKYDVIVVGGGPSGASAAKVLAEAQIRVLVIDKDDFPREKLCGGGLTANTKRAIKKIFKNIEYISREEKELHILNHSDDRFSPYITYSWKRSIIEVVDRFNFDDALLKAAINTGAKFEKDRITEIKINRDEEFELISKDRIYTSDYLIVACGTFGTKLFREKDLISPNYSIIYQTSTDNVSRGNAISFFDEGFFWKFDAESYSKIGIGKYPPHLSYERAKKILSNYSSEGINGAPIPVFNLRYSNEINKSIPGCLFVGDSGGFVNNWTGEGISYAMDSGDFAARAILKHYGDPERINQNFLDRLYKMASHLQIAEAFRKIFYKDMNRSFEILGEKKFAKLFISFLSNYHTSTKKLKFRSFFIGGVKSYGSEKIK